MAWISVHEQVLGGKLRGLAKELGCSENEALGLLVRFWLWGLDENADRDGMILNADKSDIADVVRVGLDRRYTGDQAVEAMISSGWMDVTGERIYIHDWPEWQKYWYRAQKIRKADNERKARERAERERRKAVDRTAAESPQQKAEKDIPVDSGSPDTGIPPGTPKKASNTYPTGFEEFWKAYPRRKDKGNAYKCYTARLKDGWSPAELLEAATNYALEMERKHTDQQYIKHAATFLSAATPFADYVRKSDAETGKANDDDPFGDWRGR